MHPIARVAVTRKLIVTLLRRPLLLASALSTYKSLIPSMWWRRPPFLPVVDRHWLAFRLETAYGDPAASMSSEDLVAFLQWRREQLGGLSRFRARNQNAR